MTLDVYEITGTNGLPYKVQLTPETANKLGAAKVAPAPEPEKKAPARAKSSTAKPK